MKCPDCGVMMKPLATSVYCPNDCDRKVVKEITMEESVTPKVIFWDSNNVMVRPTVTAGTSPIPIHPTSAANSSDPADGQGLDFSWMDDVDWGMGTD